jgi:hypothetical protein
MQQLDRADIIEWLIESSDDGEDTSAIIGIFLERERTKEDCINFLKERTD